MTNKLIKKERFVKMKLKQIEEAIQNLSEEDTVLATYEILQPILMGSADDLSDEELSVCLVMQWMLEMDMEGFNSFYLNFYGDEAQRSLEALSLIGSKEYLEIFKESMTVFEDSLVPTEQEDRYDRFEKDENIFNELWERLDQAYKICTEDIDGLLSSYIINNIFSFR